MLYTKDYITWFVLYINSRNSGRNQVKVKAIMDNIHKEINDAVVNNYWIKEYSSGIILLLINTVDRWISYHRYSDDEYAFNFDENEVPKYTLLVPELRELKGNYIRTEMQEKDQISYYFIPYKLIDK